MENNIYSFLGVIVEDNESFPFPVKYIRKEVEHLLFGSIEFEYFVREANRKLNYTYGKAYSQIFIYVLDMVFSTLPEKFTDEEYLDKVLEFIDLLENIKVCRIDKNSPDGETITLMK